MAGAERAASGAGGKFRLALPNCPGWAFSGPGAGYGRALGPGGRRDRPNLAQQQLLVAGEAGDGGLHQEVTAPGDQVARDDRGHRQQGLLGPGRGLLRVPPALQADEDGQTEAGPQPGNLDLVPGDDAAGLQGFHRSQADLQATAGRHLERGQVLGQHGRMAQQALSAQVPTRSRPVAAAATASSGIAAYCPIR
jgi:hypothetical protein